MAFTSTGTAASRSASAKTTWGDLPPSSNVQPMWLRAAAVWISVPTSGLPVKEMKSTSGWEDSTAPASSPSPVTTFSAPGGKPTSRASSAKRSSERQACSAGLTTQALPQASDAPTERPKIWAG